MGPVTQRAPVRTRGEPVVFSDEAADGGDLTKPELGQLERRKPRSEKTTGLWEDRKDVKSSVVEGLAMTVSQCLTEKKDTGGKWDCQAVRILFTYTTHIPKEALHALMIDKTKGQVKDEFVFWRAAHETADKTNPYEHTHVLVDWGCAFRWRNVRLLDWVWHDSGCLLYTSPSPRDRS